MHIMSIHVVYVGVVQAFGMPSPEHTPKVQENAATSPSFTFQSSEFSPIDDMPREMLEQGLPSQRTPPRGAESPPNPVGYDRAMSPTAAILVPHIGKVVEDISEYHRQTV